MFRFVFRTLVAAIILLNTFKAMAASGGEIPVGLLVSQMANLGLLVLGLFITQKKSIAQAFASKKQDFLSVAEKTMREKKEAEAKLKEVADRVAQLKNTHADQISKAKVDSEESYRTQLADAKNQAMKVQDNALMGLQFEVQKEVEKLRIETFQKSAESAEKSLEQGLSAEQKKSWNTFQNKSEVH